MNCPNCPNLELLDGPFDTKDGPFVYCDGCGYSESCPEKAVEPIDSVIPVTALEPKTPPCDQVPSIRHIMMPCDTNQYGTIFGGVILSLIDQAAFVQARKHGLHRWVTASFDKVDFLKPVRVGDNVSLYTSTLKTGTKSVQVAVEVEVERYDTNETEHVCSAKITMVSVDPNGKSIPFSHSPTIQYRA